jgi:hypothetical protein
VIAEHDVVVLKRDLPEFDLVAGDIGAVVYLYSDSEFEVEFVATDGSTVALVTLGTADIRKAGREALHARALAT